jgi:hypothetical protein
MGYLLGLKEYLKETYGNSIFDQALESKQPWEFHVHDHRIFTATILENRTYELKLDIEGQREKNLAKIQVKLLYPGELAESVRTLIKIDKKIKALEQDPIVPLKERHFVKNKSLFPLLKEKEVVFFTLLEGEIVRGIITGFTRYDITVNLKGGMPVTILRHSIYDLRNKKGRSFLKSFQEKHRDWEKSECFVHE